MEQDLQRAEEILASGEYSNGLYIELQQMSAKHGVPQFEQLIEAYLTGTPDLETLTLVLGEEE